MKLGPEGRKRAVDLESLDVETLAWKLAEAEEAMHIQQQRIKELEAALKNVCDLFENIEQIPASIMQRAVREEREVLRKKLR